ncbi:hypothetical protein GWI33_018683 [Rhynchophorus ferrugineus]|uniref:ditrans,polycis-polyprenyl diphosphate synthase [(2E,6E)-farnesyldiphosphate specific] n=1 Tax=Rhynchophorus ferrugineus TaxID=354439 RepID=A0A834HZV9_RHYFE|nr:hypothetical protein GWI33_018683 [Rhynchophorus ferrugineus]
MFIVDYCHEFSLKDKINSLEKDVHRRKKLPNHLTVLLGQENPSYNDLANIVVWCMLNHIKFLSFYDHKGQLCKHSLEKSLTPKLCKGDHILWHEVSCLNQKNGFVGRKIHIKLISPEKEGRMALVNLTGRLANQKEEITFSVEQIDQSLYKYFEFPDPEMGLHCGQNLNFFAYPPWQMALTEFLNIKTHHKLSYNRFLKKLSIYSKCEQRKGK